MNKIVENGDNLKVFRKNIFANIILRLWLTLANFIFVPLYIKFLGEETYGLITFFATLQTVLNLLGLGLSKALRKDFAITNCSNELKLYKYRLLKSVEFIYIFISLLIISICFFGKNYIAYKWLDIEKLDPILVENTIFLMGISIALQLLAGMLQGCLFGLNKQIEADLIQFIWSFLKNVGVILLLWVLKISVLEFYIWYIIVDFLYLIILRIRVYKYTKLNSDYKWSIKDLKCIKKVAIYSIALIFMSICQAGIDKLVVSKYFSLTTVGAYNTVSNLGNFVLIISASVGISVFTQFASLKSENRITELNSLYCSTNKRVNIIVCSLGVFLGIFAKEIINIWTQSDEITNIISSSAIYIVLALTFAGVQQTTYEFLLSTGVVWIDNIRAGLSCLILIIIGPIVIENFGLFGIVMCLFISNLIITIIYLVIFNIKYIKRNCIKGLMLDFIIPMLIPLTIGEIDYYCITAFSSNNIIIVLFGCVGGLITLFLSFLLLDYNFILGLFKKVRKKIWKKNY